jgi:hypothetical protein
MVSSLVTLVVSSIIGGLGGGLVNVTHIIGLTHKLNKQPMRFASILNQLTSVMEAFTIKANDLLGGTIALELERDVVLDNASW